MTRQNIKTDTMEDSTNITSLRTSALIAGLAILTMAIAAPVAELYIFPKLVVRGNAAETVNNIIANMSLFRVCIICYLTTFICDLLAAWALYVFLKPVNKNLSQLTAWFRLVYTVIALVALLNLVAILRLLNTPDYLTLFGSDQLYVQVKLYLNAFRSDWYFGILFFGIHLALLGFLVFRADYIPRILGVLLIIAGLGYFVNALKPYVFPTINLDFAKFTFYGELIFMLWLIIKGSRIQKPNLEI